MKDGANVDLRAGTFALPFGSVDVAFDPKTLRGSTHELTDLVPIAELEAHDAREPLGEDDGGEADRPGVHAHSIIAIKTGVIAPGANDGVVQYASAHLDDVESELVVKSPHSCQSHPHTIAEVRRILLAHLAENPEVTHVEGETRAERKPGPNAADGARRRGARHRVRGHAPDGSERGNPAR
ncbi:MAG: hypothetical protein ABIR79_24430 [Candidatus Binatia bacterium]